MNTKRPIMRLTIGDNHNFLIYSYQLFYQIFYRHWEKELITLWIPGDNDDWKMAARRGISAECHCGSNYLTQNGSEFKRAFPNKRLEKMEAVLDTFHSSALCERCYYLREYNDPRLRHLIPVYWQEQFAQNT